MTKLIAAVLLFVVLYLGALVAVEMMPFKLTVPPSPYLIQSHQRYTVTAYADGSIEWGVCWWYLDEVHPEFNVPDAACRVMKHIEEAHPEFRSNAKPPLPTPPNWEQAHLDERVLDWSEIER